jgi:hypothetical protein
VSFDTTTVAGGTTGSLADVPVATDSIAGAKYQRVKQANPNADQTGAYGIDTDPFRVRPRRRGTADYDSGIFDVTNGAPASVTTATIYPEGGVVINDSTEVREVRWTNTADALLGVVQLQPKEPKPLPVPLAGSWVGLKMGANGANVRAQIAGAQ